MHIYDTHRFFLLLGVLALISGSLLAWRFGYTPEIGKFFAAEPGAQGFPSFEMKNVRGGDAVVLDTPGYGYAPSVMKQGDIYRMWWCSAGPSGDVIAYAEASSPAGPWHSTTSTKANSYDVVLYPTHVVNGIPGVNVSGNNDFDGQHVCDPSVVYRPSDGWYFMYYGGGPLQGASLTNTTRIGVAQSRDGIHWVRMHDGRPIIVPAAKALAEWEKRDGFSYGVGQPSVVYVDGYFYMIHTDTTGAASNPVSGAGQYVIRSQEPTFQANVEDFTGRGFAPSTNATRTSHQFLEASSVDWQYIDDPASFVVAHHNNEGQTDLTFFSGDLTEKVYNTSISGVWVEGPGLVSTPDKHSIRGAGCCTLVFDVMRAVNKVQEYLPSRNVPQDIGWVGADAVYAQTEVPLDQPPIGYFDAIDCQEALGWATDPDSTAPVIVRFFDGPAQDNWTNFLGEITANELREAPVGAHGFRWSAPEQLRDGVSHRVYAYAYSNETPTVFYQLPAGDTTEPPTAFTCPIPVVSPTAESLPAVPTSPAPEVSPDVSALPEPVNSSPAINLPATPGASANVLGDANGDRVVNIFDYSLVVTNFGKSGTGIPGDVDNDGDVDIFDYSQVILNFSR